MISTYCENATSRRCGTAGQEGQAVQHYDLAQPPERALWPRNHQAVQT